IFGNRQVIQLHRLRCREVIDESSSFQIVTHNLVAPILLRARIGPVGAHSIEIAMSWVDPKAKDALQFVGRTREIANVTLTIRNYDFSLRDTADEEAVIFEIKGDPFRNKLRIVQSKGYRRNRCLRFFIFEGLPDLLKLWIIPDGVEFPTTIWNESELAAF